MGDKKKPRKVKWVKGRKGHLRVYVEPTKEEVEKRHLKIVPTSGKGSGD